jgi:glycerol-3-phosphate acyltransferase PlsY
VSFGEEFSFVFGRYGIYILIAAVIAYLIGSINTSIITTKIVAHKDIRTMGSGNAGFTNVLRTVGKGPAIVTFIGDFLKGVVSILIAYLILIGFNDEKMNLVRQYAFYISGLACVLGHMYPIFYGFKGGKGVVTTASVMLMTDWRTLVAALVVFAIMFATTKVISKCALVNASVYPITTFCFRYFLDYMPNPSNSLVFVFFSTFITLIIAIMVIYRHKDNIKRIINGTEKKITAKK